MNKTTLLGLLFALASLATACGPSISSLGATCSAADGTVKWEASGDDVTLYSGTPVQGTGKVSPSGELKYSAAAPVIFWLTATSGSDKVTTGAVCR
jgi:hypothetical protein